MKTNKVRFSRRIAIALASILMFSIQAGSQLMKSRNDAFATIPREQRAKFFQRLRLFVDAQSERRWNDMYGLSFSAIDGSVTRGAFARENEKRYPGRKDFALVAFTPTAATVVNKDTSGEEWLVEGCAKYRETHKRHSQMAGLNAKLHDGRWYFSSVSELTSGADGPPLPCARTFRTQVSKHNWRRGS